MGLRGASNGLWFATETFVWCRLFRFESVCIGNASASIWRTVLNKARMLGDAEVPCDRAYHGLPQNRRMKLSALTIKNVPTSLPMRQIGWVTEHVEYRLLRLAADVKQRRTDFVDAS